MLQKLLLLVRLVLRAYQIVMIVSAVLSWIPDLRQSKIKYFCDSLTEPVLRPVRSLLNRIGGLGSLPIDISFLLVYILLAVIINII
ncbi:MAG: YggT family protein [Clostridia bacterium]|nr:YggT family protein [Clostridia bacterium]